jgi:hypothetical protein
MSSNSEESLTPPTCMSDLTVQVKLHWLVVNGGIEQEGTKLNPVIMVSLRGASVLLAELGKTLFYPQLKNVLIRL